MEPGSYGILVGASSRDIRLTETVLIKAPLHLPPLEEDSTLSDLILHENAFARVCFLFNSKTGQPLQQVRQLLEDNAPDIFTSTYRALTSIFGLDITREEFRQAVDGR